MEELVIELDCLRAKRGDLEISISKPFEYGRSPENAEYLELEAIINELKEVTVKISFAEEVISSIESNLVAISRR